MLVMVSKGSKVGERQMLVMATLPPLLRHAERFFPSWTRSESRVEENELEEGVERKEEKPRLGGKKGKEGKELLE